MPYHLLYTYQYHITVLSIYYQTKRIITISDVQPRGKNAATVAKIGFFKSQEYRNKNRRNTEFVTDCYRALMGRDPDATGLADWVGRLDRGEMSRAEVIEHGFGHSAVFSRILRSYGLKMAE